MSEKPTLRERFNQLLDTIRDRVPFGLRTLLGILLTMIQVSGGVRLPRDLNATEREILRDGIAGIAEELAAGAAFSREYEV